MKRITFILLACIWAILPANAQSGALLDLIGQEMKGLPDGTEWSMAVLEDGVWIKMGYRLENGALVEVDNHTRLFEVGSITKTFTAALVLKLEAEGQIGINDPVSKYLPVQMARDTFQGHTITVRHLITHTSGLSDGPSSFTLPYLRALLFSPKNPNKYFKARHMYRYLKNFELDYIPGSDWDYNNLNYGLLGTFTESLTGTSWESAVQTTIFEPLGMESSCFEINRSNKKQLVTGITAKGKRSRPWEMQFINPAGAIKSTLDDMIKYTEVQLQPGGGALGFYQRSQDALEYRIKMPQGKLWQGNAMGLGWWHNLEDNEHPFLWHAGASGGYTAFVGFLKNKKKAVVILSNISSSNPLARAENRIPKPILLGQKILRM